MEFHDDGLKMLGVSCNSVSPPVILVSCFHSLLVIGSSTFLEGNFHFFRHLYFLLFPVCFILCSLLVNSSYHSCIFPYCTSFWCFCSLIGCIFLLSSCFSFRCSLTLHQLSSLLNSGFLLYSSFYYSLSFHIRSSHAYFHHNRLLRWFEFSFRLALKEWQKQI